MLQKIKFIIVILVIGLWGVFHMSCAVLDAASVTLTAVVQAQPPPGSQGPFFHQIYSASSSDGLRWTLDNRLLIDHASVPAAVVTSEGKLRIYYVDASTPPETTNCAESSDGGLTLGVLGCTIANRAGEKALDPSIVRLPDGRYRLYYYASSADPGKPGTHSIYSAISDDGIHFTTEKEVFSYPGLVDPDVFWTGEVWLMFVFSDNDGATIVARSRDGLSFEYVGPLGLPGWGTTAPVKLDDGRFRLYAFDQRTSQTVASFISSDGLTWAQEPSVRLTAPVGQRITDPFVVRLPDGTWKMVYKTERANAAALSNDLIFIPDPGIRVENAAIPAPGVDVTGTVYLYYEDTSASPPRQLVATSSDGLKFSPGNPPKDRANDPRRLLLPDGRTWRLYVYDQRFAEMRSESSTDGLRFTPDPGVHYRPQPNDNGTIGVYDHFADSAGGVVLLYVGDMMGLNNVRRAYSPPGDNGWTFTFTNGNVLGDANAGGGPSSYVDPKSIRLPDGRRRLFTMTQGSGPKPPVGRTGEIHSFISNDDGKTFSLESGIRLKWSDFAEFEVRSLNDPWVVLLPDGRYRMYVAALIADGSSSGRWAIVSATTPKP